MVDRGGVGGADPYNLERFVAAQLDVYDSALLEIKSGSKRSHWMWFIFPQILGLGTSDKALFYAIRNAGEAALYLEHPILGKRLLECAVALLTVKGRTASEIFGYPDDIKLKSSMTLFDYVAGPDSVFAKVLGTYFSGEHDEKTLQLLRF